jgi:hypothetical protein
VAERAVELVEVLARGDRGLQRVAPLVHPEVLAEPEAATGAGDELPRAGRARPRGGSGGEAALDHGEVHGVPRETAAREQRGHHRDVPRGAGHPLAEPLPPRALEELDVLGDRRLHLHRDVVLGGEGADVEGREVGDQAEVDHRLVTGEQLGAILEARAQRAGGSQGTDRAQHLGARLRGRIEDRVLEGAHLLELLGGRLVVVVRCGRRCAGLRRCAGRRAGRGVGRGRRCGRGTAEKEEKGERQTNFKC